MNYLSDLHAGRAGEHLAAADLLRRGVDCFHAAQGMPYDLVADVGGRLLRVQVKTTRRPEVLAERNVNNVAYRFWVSRCGKGGKGRYGDEVDLFALVALQEQSVGYLPASRMVRTLFVRPAAMRGTFADEVVVERNAKAAADLRAGVARQDVMARYGLPEHYLRSLKNGKARHVSAGVYMADLGLSSALKALGFKHAQTGEEFPE